VTYAICVTVWFNLILLKHQNARDDRDDRGDVFRIDVVGQDGTQLHGVKTVSSVFRLTHVGLGCVLHSHDKQLPQW